MTLRNFRIDQSWTLFLDRDGVINRRIIGGYVSGWEEFHFLPGVQEALSVFAQRFGRVVVVSNQQGVGKGLMTPKQVEEIHRRMQEEVSLAGGRIDSVYYAPQLESSGSNYRKPGIGMALRARKEFREIHYRQSLMAGDSLSDMRFGKRLGMVTILIAEDCTLARRHPELVDFNFTGLKQFADAL